MMSDNRRPFPFGTGALTFMGVAIRPIRRDHPRVMTRRLIVHLDMDAFYVSVERLRDPSLKGKPVIVGGSPDGRGVVASASYEARAFGVRSAMPSSVAARLCPQAVWVHGAMENYAEYSQRINAVLETFTPVVQMASQDEAYLDMTGTERLWGPPLQMGDRLRSAVMGATSLPCSLGIGPTRTVAKIASAACKPRGMLWVPALAAEAFLARLDVSAMPGIGAKTEARLRAIGLRTLGDIQRLGRDPMRRVLGEHGVELWERAMALRGGEVGTAGDAKSISNEVTFETDLTDRADMADVLLALAEKVASRARASGAVGRTISLKYRYAGFETHTAARTLSSPTCDEGIVHQVAVELLEAKRDQARAIRLLGVALTSLEYDGGQQDLVEQADGEERHARLLGAIDTIRDRYGFQTIRRLGARNRSRGEWG